MPQTPKPTTTAGIPRRVGVGTDARRLALVICLEQAEKGVFSADGVPNVGGSDHLPSSPAHSSWPHGNRGSFSIVSHDAALPSPPSPRRPLPQELKVRRHT